MDTATMWAVGILSGASGGGFLLLLGLINKVSDKLKSIDSKVEQLPDYKYLHETYMPRESFELHMKNIDQKLITIDEKVSELINVRKDI